MQFDDLFDYRKPYPVAGRLIAATNKDLRLAMKAAEFLGIDRKTLRAKIRKYGLG